MAFLRRPPFDLREIDPVSPGDHQSLIEALSVCPVIERGETIHHALRGREYPDTTGLRLQLRPDLDVQAADHDWCRRELDQVVAVLMLEVPVGSSKSQARHHGLQS